MSEIVKIDRTYLQKFVSDEDLKGIEGEISAAYNTLVNKSGEGNDFLGWLDYPSKLNDEFLDKISEYANRIRSNSQVLIVIGIGGSYLGSKAVISALSPYFEKDSLEIIFAGNSLSSTYLNESLHYCLDKDFSICVISKSGTTTETSVAFRLFKELLIRKYGDEFASRIYAVTDKDSGALRTEVEAEGYACFELPKDIGGRFSVITPVGLFPIACAGLNLKEFAKGIKDACDDLSSDNTLNNPANLYACIRNVLYRQGKLLEILVSYEPKLENVAEWWKQLYGESEGKDHKGIFPASVIYSRDLHSLGQFVQDGSRIMFETVVKFDKPLKNAVINGDEKNLDGLNYLAGKDVDYVNMQACIGTAMAHEDGLTPSLFISLEKLDEYHLGYLLYFFMFACGVSGYTLGVNPFNQPGVEAYKKNMFRLLKKPGYDK